jgi:hypothetical protein
MKKSYGSKKMTTLVQTNPEKLVKCLEIKQDGNMSSISLLFDFGLNNKPSFEIIAKNMKSKYDCPNFRGNIALAFFPNDSYYSIFYQAHKNSINNLENKVGESLINTSGTDIKCYGACFVLHFDRFYEMYDIGMNEFINACKSNAALTGNTIYTSKGITTNNRKLVTQQKKCCIM